jgi:hypothetical protein
MTGHLGTPLPEKVEGRRSDPVPDHHHACSWLLEELTLLPRVARQHLPHTGVRQFGRDLVGDGRAVCSWHQRAACAEGPDL